MASLTLRLRYDGLLATEQWMPPSLEKQITDGAQEFLGAHAYLFTEGLVPDRVLDRSKHFRIGDIRPRRGCWEALYAIDIATIAGDFAQEYTRQLTKDLAADAATATKLGFLYLVHKSYHAFRNRRPMSERTFDRIEPMLTETVGNGAPIFDPEFEQVAQRRRLYERTNSSMSKMTAPIGRAATYLDMWLDDVQLDHIERRFFSDQEIATALLPLRTHWDGYRRV